jgi:acetyltransferase-like isoleucine patch superfamily enzyme
MSKLIYYFKILLGLSKSLRLSCHYFGWKGFNLPIIVTWRTRLASVQGEVKLEEPLGFGKIRIGFCGVALSSFHQWNVWNVKGKIIFAGRAEFGTGSRLFVGTHGCLSVGDNFLLTANSEIICNHRIEMGRDVLLSWDTLIMDTDSHPIRNKQLKVINQDRPIVIGNNVWVGCRSIILKGSIIKNNSVIAAGSLTHKNYLQENVLIGGFPAAVIMSDIVWQWEQFNS